MRSAWRLRRVASAGFAALLMSSLASRAHAGTAAERPTIERVVRAVYDPDSSGWAAAQLRRMLAAGEIDSSDVPISREFLVTALINSGAPASVYVPAADSAIALFADVPGDRAEIHQSVATAMLRGGDSTAALARFRLADAAAAAAPAFALMRARLLGSIANIEIARGDATTALATIDTALTELPADDIATRQSILAERGRIHESLGHEEAAIGDDVASRGVFLGQDTTAAAPLRALWAKRHGSSPDLAARIAQARRESKRAIAFEARRVDKPAPRWALEDLGGRPRSIAAHRGSVVVLDFWASWCRPCELELPHIQRIYERYRTKGAALLTVNVEHDSTRAAQVERAGAFMKEHHFTFPVLPDFAGDVVRAHGVGSFPTVLVIDRHGIIRYRNNGYTDSTPPIIELQIEALLAEH